MILALHGAAGGWDEVAVAIVAFGVLWIAVKLAGRHPDNADEDDAPDRAEAELVEEQKDPAHPTPLG